MRFIKNPRLWLLVGIYPFLMTCASKQEQTQPLFGLWTYCSNCVVHPRMNYIILDADLVFCSEYGWFSSKPNIDTLRRRVAFRSSFVANDQRYYGSCFNFIEYTMLYGDSARFSLDLNESATYNLIKQFEQRRVDNNDWQKIVATASRGEQDWDSILVLPDSFVHSAIRDGVYKRQTGIFYRSRIQSIISIFKEINEVKINWPKRSRDNVAYSFELVYSDGSSEKLSSYDNPNACTPILVNLMYEAIVPEAD